MSEQQFWKDFIKREIECGCYNAKINKVSLYSFIRGMVREEMQEKNAIYSMPSKGKIDKKGVLKSISISLWHIVRVLFLKKHFRNVFYPFARVDKIGGVYLDKFTDPIIDCCELTDYIIFDRGRAGLHPQPRLHKNNIIYVDFLQFIALILSLLSYKWYIKKHYGVFKQFESSLEILLKKEVSKKLLKECVFGQYYSMLFEFLLKKIGAVNVIGPARSQQMCLFVAAHRLGLRTLELQHGVTYGETRLYSGYRDPMILPDFFLAFGENRPLNVYGIDEDRIVNVGFAMLSYIRSALVCKQNNKNSVLVISDPEITEKIINIVVDLAEDNTSCQFYFRLHPHETISDTQQNRLESRANIHIQDRSINILEALLSFDHVIGESSTVLYEAISMGKKVGKLHCAGLSPLYLLESDRKYFWQITNLQDFRDFLSDNNYKEKREIYSDFDKNKFLCFLN